ncbi:GNAT family N-acetyltransferase [Paenisporosarcina cavernae]|uniref:GNAT family N-acetyltransferase n=1 Tax=Paenisporosarcina cavernae TaxID=2320858 RepID=A0A385YWZ3_9BACL|nr:GNAT family N-acetyltransferase [Paenisporosarcina cavernae]AYC30063.1 GNAT family N-acetyltransferase [Paenisporosarcina cavernae]
MIRLLTKDDYVAASQLIASAYPGMGLDSEEKLEQFQERLRSEQETKQDLRYYGKFNVYEKLVGLYRLHDFLGNIHGEKVRQFGIGMVAVDFFHKKEKVAFDLLTHFHETAASEGVCFTTLYPFSIPFYHKMGYGLGPTRYEFRLLPKEFPSSGDKSRVQFFEKKENKAINELYERFVDQTHGMISRTSNQLDMMEKRVTHYAGVKEDDRITAAVAYKLVPVAGSHFLDQEMVIYEWFWESSAAFRDTCAWIASQQDQVGRVVYRTQDVNFLHVVGDPRNDSNILIHSVYHEVANVGAGLMYRILDIEKFVATTQFSYGMKPSEPTSFTFNVNDSFHSPNQGTYELTFAQGKWEISKSTDPAEFDISISDLSAWWMGTASLARLAKYGNVTLHTQRAAELDRYFQAQEMPMCLTSF